MLLDVNETQRLVSRKRKSDNKKISSAGDIVSYRSRRGYDYYLHAGSTKLGKAKYFMSRSAEGALTKMPDGFEIVIDLNGIVSIRRIAAAMIPEVDLKTVRSIVHSYSWLHRHKVEVKGKVIIVYEPLGFDASNEARDNSSESFSILNSFEALAQLRGWNKNQLVAQFAKKFENVRIIPILILLEELSIGFRLGFEELGSLVSSVLGHK